MPPTLLVFGAIAAVLGTLAATPLPLDVRVTVAGGCVLVCAWAARSESRAFRAAVLAALVAATINASVRLHAQPQVSQRRTARYAGTLLERVPRDDGGTAVTVALDDGLHVLAEVRAAAPAPGTRVLLRGRLEPFDEARNPGEPSERELERERGLDARVDGASILAASAGSPWDARAWLPRAHEWASLQLRDRLGEPSATILAGELWGERAALPPDLRAEFQETGTVHVLVTAGLHLGAVAALAMLLVAPLALPRVAACALVAAIVWAFVLWSGAALPAVRAATMLTAALSARACGRATWSWNVLALAAIALALARPQSVGTASFALSFSCVGAIFACARPIEAWIEARLALPLLVREALVLSIATQLGTWPLSAAVFLQFSPYALLANLAVVPCVAVTMALGAAQLALAWMPPLAQACANLNSWPLAWMTGVVRTISSLPGAVLPMTPAPAWCIAAYDAALVAAPWFLRRGAPALALGALLLSGSFVLWPPRAIDTRLRITVLDVGQADGIVVQTPLGHAFLVDAGGRLERGTSGDDSVAERVGERIVVPFLLRNGIHQLDALVTTHPHG
ncbi:MAG TPA: ComEC/Rec2 family competence protein, partial [Verrucomicrobiae bacterium]|nr:ComEC/Rec2 family competence protein [Verrucomicrobiae bacterium]